VMATGADDLGEMVRVLDLDVLRVGRLATVVAGFLLTRDLCGLMPLLDGDGEAGRGVLGLMGGCGPAAVAGTGMARVVDLAWDGVEAETELAVVAALAEIAPWAVGYGFAGAKAVGSVVSAARRAQGAGVRADPAGRASARRVEWVGAYSVERALVCALTAGRT